MSHSKEKVIIIGVRLLDTSRSSFDESMNELEKLVETARGQVIVRLEQTLKSPVPATYVGKGKLEEVKQILDEHEAFTVVFDEDLKPNQARNIENALGRDVKVIDRSGLILDIFATRARTSAAKIQVELAQLEYILPRLSGMWAHFSRQYGGSIGARGPGETQLETDRRVIRRRIAALHTKLDKIEVQRRTQRRARSSQFRVSLLGYTNAGKSTLINRLTNASAFAEDKLFATLDPRTRKFRTRDGRTALFTDTVGFIRKLPHHLIESFRSTLAEAIEADLLLIVADASHEALDEHLSVVEDELSRMRLQDANKLLIFNKIDITDEFRLCEIKHNYPEGLLISAKSSEGIDVLIDSVLSFANIVSK